MVDKTNFYQSTVISFINDHEYVKLKVITCECRD